MAGPRRRCVASLVEHSELEFTVAKIFHSAIHVTGKFLPYLDGSLRSHHKQSSHPPLLSAFVSKSPSSARRQIERRDLLHAPNGRILAPRDSRMVQIEAAYGCVPRTTHRPKTESEQDKRILVLILGTTVQHKGLPEAHWNEVSGVEPTIRQLRRALSQSTRPVRRQSPRTRRVHADKPIAIRFHRHPSRHPTPRNIRIGFESLRNAWYNPPLPTNLKEQNLPPVIHCSRYERTTDSEI